MPQFLVTCVCDEGVYENSFRIVEAPSRIAVADSMLRRPYPWADWLRRACMWEEVRDKEWNAEQFLARIDKSYVDGDSQYRLSLFEVKAIERVDEFKTNDKVDR